MFEFRRRNEKITRLENEIEGLKAQIGAFQQPTSSEEEESVEIRTALDNAAAHFDRSNAADAQKKAKLLRMIKSKHEHKEEMQPTGELSKKEFEKNYVDFKNINIEFKNEQSKRANFHLELDGDEWIFERLNRYSSDYKMEGELLIKFDMKMYVDGVKVNGTFIIFVKSAKIYRLKK